MNFAATSFLRPSASPVPSGPVQFGNISAGRPLWADVKRLLTLAEQTLKGEKTWQPIPVPAHLRDQMAQSFQTQLSDGTWFTYSLPNTVSLDSQTRVAVTYERNVWRSVNGPSTDHLTVEIPQEPQPRQLALNEAFQEATALMNKALLFNSVTAALGYTDSQANQLNQSLKKQILSVRARIPKLKK